MRILSTSVAAFFVTLTAFAANLRVTPGQSIQAAVDRAHSGDRITVVPGTYHETGRPCPTEPGKTCAVVISIDNLTLDAEFFLGRPVILENAGHQDTGIAFANCSSNDETSAQACRAE